MEESVIHENTDLGMSRLRGGVAEVKNGALGRGSMDEIGEHRPRLATDLDPRSREISEIQETSGNFPLETREEMLEKGQCQHLPMHSLFAGEVDFEDEEGVNGISVDVEGARIPRSDMIPHRGAGPATEIGRGKCAMTESVSGTSRPAGGKMTSGGNGRNAKEMSASEESNLFAQTPEILQGDSRRPSHLVQLR